MSLICEGKNEGESDWYFGLSLYFCRKDKGMPMDGHEEDLIGRFARGEERAFRVLYERHVVGLRYFAAKYLTDDADIEDVLQDVFVELWEKRADFREEEAVKAWLYQAVRNDCLNLKRHRQVRTKYAERVAEEGEPSESFLDRMLEAEVFEALREVFDTLPPACKEVYRLSLEGKSHEEIAARLHITVNTVKKHKNNANHYMRERLKRVLSLLALFA